MLADRSFRLVVALAAVAALSACGETHRTLPTAHATPRNVGSVAPTVFPAPTKSVAPAASESAAPASSAPATAAAGGNAVTATAANTFDPKTLTVKKGATVTWTAQGFHTVTSGTPTAPDPSGPMKAEIGFKTYKVTFDKPGTYAYFCQPHGTQGMVGEIVVT